MNTSLFRIQHSAQSATYINLDKIISVSVFEDDDSKIQAELLLEDKMFKVLRGAEAERLIQCLEDRRDATDVGSASADRKRRKAQAPIRDAGQYD